MKIEGGCHCGEIRFAAEIDPDKVRICHCTDCQTLSSSAFRIMVPVPESDFHLLSGQPKHYIKTTSDSGARRVQAFCSECGTAIYATSVGGDNRSFGIRTGSIDQRAQLSPKRQYWCQSKLQWLPELPGVTHQRQ